MKKFLILAFSLLLAISIHAEQSPGVGFSSGGGGSGNQGGTTGGTTNAVIKATAANTLGDTALTESSGVLSFPDVGKIQFSSTGVSTGTADVALVRESAGRLRITNAASSTTADITLNSMDTAGYVNAAGYVAGDGFSMGVTAKSGARLYSTFVIGWSSTTNTSSAADTALVRNAAGVVGITDGSTGGGILEMPQVSSGGTVSSNSARLYSKDVAGTAEMFVKDEAGNETQISPHSKTSPKAKEIEGDDPNGVIIHDKNEYLGKERWLHLTALAREVEKLTGKKFLIEREIPKRDWDADQAALKAKHDEARSAEQKAAADFAKKNKDKDAKAPKVRGEFKVKKNPFSN